jgi:hypothetical protein
MKKITLAVLLMASLCAHAETFQNIQLKVETCHDIGNFAAGFYKKRAAGEPKMAFKDDGTHMNMIFRYAVDYAWGDATDATDAALRVRAKCLDNYDFAVANDRNGVARPERLN